MIWDTLAASSWSSLSQIFRHRQILTEGGVDWTVVDLMDYVSKVILIAESLWLRLVAWTAFPMLLDGCPWNDCSVKLESGIIRVAGEGNNQSGRMFLKYEEWNLRHAAKTALRLVDWSELLCSWATLFGLAFRSIEMSVREIHGEYCWEAPSFAKTRLTLDKQYWWTSAPLMEVVAFYRPSWRLLTLIMGNEELTVLFNMTTNGTSLNR